MRPFARRIIACASALALSCSLVPLAASADEGEASPAPPVASGSSRSLWLSDEVLDEMLQAGEYAEGEAIVVVDNTVAEDGARSRAISPLDAAEPLMDVSAQAYEETTGETVADPAAAESGASAFSSEGSNGIGQTSGEAEALSIVLVRQEGASTEDLLRELAQDPRVVSAEPNYLIQLPDSEEADGVARAATGADGVGASAAPVSDLTDSQWTEGNDGDRLTIRHDGKTAQEGFDINESSWTAAKEAGWSAASDNASGTVAVMDSGIDYTHPDLAGVMWDGEDLAQLAGEGGPYGLNVSGSGDEADVMDRNEHGTHCAGIIASSWDGCGTSGVANGVQLISVKMLGDNGQGSIGSELRGYDYLVRIATAVNLKAVNNSWGGASTYLAFSLAVTELGRLGVVSVFATGNDGLDTDRHTFTAAALATNPYVVNINSSDVTGQLSAFSNYGAYTSDLAAPGSSILSTVPTTMRHFFPEAADAGELAAYETFAQDTQSVTAYAGEPREAAATVEADGTMEIANGRTDIGGLDDVLHYDESSSLSVKLSDMDEVPGDELAGMALASGTGATRAYTFDLSIAVPEDVRSDPGKLGRFALKCLNTDFTVAEKKRMYIGVWAIGALDSNGEVQLAVNEGEQAMSGRARMVDGWAPLSLDVAQLLEDTGMDEVAFDENGAMTVRMAVLLPYEPQAGDAVNLDCIGLGSGEGSIGSYDVLSGTSMAAPVATGAVAVLARAEASNEDVLSRQGSDAVAALAAERAACLKGSTTPSEDFAGTCRTNGVLDLGVADTDMTPSITAAQAGADGKTVAVSGYFFGGGSGASAVSIDGKPCEIVSWSADSVEVMRPSGQQSGGASISLTASNGKTTQARATLLFPDDGPEAPLYEKTLASPAEADGFMEEGPALFSLTSLDGSLYLLTIDETFCPQGLWHYDIARDAWSRCADLPGVGSDAALVCSPSSLAAYRGQVMLLATEERGLDAANMLYSYRPESDTWQEAPCEDAGSYSGIAAWGDSLLLVAGDGNEGGKDIRSCDPQTGEVEPLADLPVDTLLPSLAVSSDTLAIAQGMTSEYIAQQGLLMRAAETDGVWKVGLLEGVLPAENPYGIGLGCYGFAGYRGGTAVVGLPDPGEDTALLANDGAQLEPLGKTLSNDVVYSPAATACDGFLYALGVSNLESDRVVFRATVIDAGSNPGGDGENPGEGDAGEGSSQEGKAGEGAPAKQLASTGDDAMTLVAAFGSLALAACAAIGCAATRKRRSRRP